LQQLPVNWLKIIFFHAENSKMYLKGIFQKAKFYLPLTFILYFVKRNLIDMTEFFAKEKKLLI